MDVSIRVIMEIIDFTFRNLKPVSLNNSDKNIAFKRGGKVVRSRGKTKAANDFEQRIRLETLKYRPNIFDFETAYSPYEHYLTCQITFYMPIDKLITKKGYVSSRSMDLDNLPKYVIDGIFKSFDKIDDKSICQINTLKVPSPDNNYHIYMALMKRDLTELINYTDQFNKNRSEYED